MNGAIEEPQGLPLLKWSLCAALLSGLAFCPRLWISNRGFPTAPVIEGLPDLSPLWICALVAGVLAIAFLPRPGVLYFAVPVLGGLLVLSDINRLQPWFYQYLLMFLALSLGAKGRAVCGFILSATYIWSGLQKANVSFVERVFPELIKPLGLNLASLGYAVPVLEVAVGVLLLIPRTRRFGVYGAVAMHGFLLYALGPLGLDRNSVIWPWNFWMAVMAVLLFLRNDEPVFRPLWSSMRGKAIFVLVGVLPALNFFGLWDGYLSASLYSGRAAGAWLVLTDSGAKRLGEVFRSSRRAMREDEVVQVGLYDWAMAEMNVPPYPEVRIYDAIARKLKATTLHGEKVLLTVGEKPGLTERELIYRTYEVR